MRFRFNPLSADFEIKEFPTSALPIAPAVWVDTTKICDVSAAVGDFVYIDPAVANKVLVNTDNVIDYPTIGIIIAKITSTLCRVALYGEITGFAGLTQADYVFLSPTGDASTSHPAAGYIQILGYATGPDRMILNPQILRTKRA
jgi:hypothetical protein